MAACIFLALALAPVATDPTPTVTVVWNDSAHLFPSVGLDRLGDALEALFRESGLSVRFHVAAPGENLQTIPEPRVNTIVIPREDTHFGLPRNTMAAALGKPGERYSIFVFFPGVRRTLGYREGSFAPRYVNELARALARVVAHEVVHVLAPERGHAETGLMARNLGRKELLAQAIALDRPSVESVRGALRTWEARPDAGSKFPVRSGTLRSIVAPEVPFPCPSAS